MRRKARKLGVDLLLVDTGMDLNLHGSSCCLNPRRMLIRHYKGIYMMVMD